MTRTSYLRRVEVNQVRNKEHTPPVVNQQLDMDRYRSTGDCRVPQVGTGDVVCVQVWVQQVRDYPQRQTHSKSLTNEGTAETQQPK